MNTTNREALVKANRKRAGMLRENFNQDLRHEVKGLRAKYPNLALAQVILIARGKLTHAGYNWDDPPRNFKLYGEWVIQQAEWTRGPVRFVSKLVPDNDADMDDTGKVERLGRHETREDNDKRPGHFAVWVEGSAGRSDYIKGWYIPEYSYESRYRDAPKGMSRHTRDCYARQGVKEAAEHLMAYYRDEWQFVGVCTRGYIGDVKVGEQDLWGVSVEGRDFEYVDEVAHEQEQEILAEALTSIEAQIWQHAETMKALHEAAREMGQEDAQRGAAINEVINLRAMRQQLNLLTLEAAQNAAEHTRIVETELL
jgi:hypothetical protein